jgi:methylase of polypeptide subunit release factors
MTRSDAALLELLRVLAAAGYRFVAPTPATHRRVLNRREGACAESLRDVFGWSLPFEASLLPAALLDPLARADALVVTAQGLKSRVRVSSRGDLLFLHSAFPTDAEDAVFFGPDSYRFARLIEEALPPDLVDGTIVDVGAGSGIGGITAAALTGREVVLTDVNPKALRLARINAAFAGVRVRTIEGEGLSGVAAPVAAVLANPPYIDDAAGREYRDGGAMHGGALSVEMAQEAARRLAPGGRLILYTGAAIVDGVDELQSALEAAMAKAGCRLDYREIDPDVFGEELDRAAYADVERIAVIAAIADKDVGS